MDDITASQNAGDEEPAEPVVREVEQQAERDAELLKYASRLSELYRELNELYPERAHLTRQIIYALLTREHVLVHGMYGTAKTHLANAVFNAFEGQTTFSVQLTKFMTEANVIGVPDPRKMREEGVVYYNPAGQILEADFAELDELFDANSPLLRTLLSVLNEREFKRGKQHEFAKLHTAIAATNGEPDEVIRHSPELGAVIDRFLFRCKIGYLQSPTSRLQMYMNFSEMKAPSVRLPFDRLKELSDLVLNRVSIDDTVWQAYDCVLHTYQSYMPDQVVSDRRKCKLIQLMRAHAVLGGRFVVQPADIEAIRWGLCIGNDQQQHDAFIKAIGQFKDGGRQPGGGE